MKISDALTGVNCVVGAWPMATWPTTHLKGALGRGRSRGWRGTGANRIPSTKGSPMSVQLLHAAPRAQGPDAGPDHAADATGRELDRALTVFLAERTRLLRIAHRVTGDRDAADDVVQEVWVRWQRTTLQDVRNPSAFLATATTHMAINVIQSARSRHEIMASFPLAEPPDPSADPTTYAERSEALDRALELVMTRLNPTERAAYLLRKGFEYPYQRIADVLPIKIAHARQLVRRSQAKLTQARAHQVGSEAHGQLVQTFLAAARTGDLRPLESLLAQEAAGHASCPSKASQPSRPRGH